MCEAMRRLIWDEIEAEVKKGRQEGLQQGRQDGRLEQARDTACALRDMGLPTDSIAKAVKVSIETIEGWFAEQQVQI